MEWNGESSSSFLYNYSHDHNPAAYPGMELEHEQEELCLTETINIPETEKRKRLTKEQVALLENSFQMDIRLDPNKKIELSKELGLHPRQVAIWYQNRRARWKVKHLEHLYFSLKHDFDVLSKEKQQLEEQVMKLRAILRQVSGGGGGGYTEIMSWEGTVESTSEAHWAQGKIHHDHLHQQIHNDHLHHNTTTVPDFPYQPTLFPYYQ